MQHSIFIIAEQQDLADQSKYAFEVTSSLQYVYILVVNVQYIYMGVQF